MVGTVEIWKVEILTVVFTACGIPLVLHRIDDSGWKVFFTARCMSLEFALNLTIRMGVFFFDHVLHEFIACTEFVFERCSHSSHIPRSLMRC